MLIEVILGKVLLTNHQNIQLAVQMPLPEAESQRQHDSRTAQWGFFEFPGKDSHGQDTKYSDLKVIPPHP